MKKYNIWFFVLLLVGCWAMPLQAQKKKPKKEKINTQHIDTPSMSFDLSYLKTEENLDNLYDLMADATNYLLIIAVDKYTYWKPLKNAVKDANDVKSALVKRYRFDPKNVYEIYDDNVTAERIRAMFEKLKASIGPNDNLMIYFSGHGFYDASFDEGYWIPYDGKIGQVSTYIPNTNILNYIRAIDSRHTFLVADACFSGSMFADGNRGYLDKVEQLKSRWGLSSGNVEFVSDGKEGENSPFARYLLKFLNENLKDRFSVTELIQYVKVAVADNTDQTPIGNPLKNVGNEGGEFVFYLK
ncbi:caspase family protein [Eisenibacter elegans]|uniref:caspase family protein n=1 Tax=Eisenibacter elegans TaxID=997 RepID=UPI00040B0F19|nr:caspase family protein [Eisenibacter elegans]